MKHILIIVIAVVTVTTAQRPSFAGISPIGYPIIVETTTISNDVLGNRFGEDDTPTTTIRLPIEARGDVALVTRLRMLPIDQQPFWLINWAALEAYRKNPQTYPQKPNIFASNNVQMI